MRNSEAILAALADVVRVAGLTVSAGSARNEVLPVKLPAGGYAIVFDGDPGEPEETFSPLRFHYEHVAEIDVVVAGASAAQRDAKFDALVAAIGAALVADRTLGGLVDYMQARAPVTDVDPVEGAEALKSATIPVVLHYATPDPLS